MSAFSPGKTLLSLAAATLLWLTGTELTGGKVFASCGDYLHTRKSFQASQKRLMEARDLTTTRTSRNLDGTPYSPEPHPCSGPGCRRSSPPSSLPVHIASSVHSMPEGLMTGSGRSEPNGHGRPERLRRFIARSVPGFPLSVDIPPEFTV